MDGEQNIEDRRQVLMRILATLVAMAGLSHRTTVSRHLRNAVLRLLRPAESATRRLAIALAHGIAVALPARRPRKPRPVRRRRHFMPVMPPEPAAPKRPFRPFALPLLDPPRRRARPRAPRRAGVPRIGLGPRPPMRPQPSPHDRLDAARLGFRLDALAAALADLPKQALRFARWQARRHHARALGSGGRAAFRPPLRLGRPPGGLRRPAHEVQDVLGFAHELALRALKKHPDTS